jgi:ABC-type bacteriocin/lantibiotic exporter with double-glycine peptidase domain
MLALLSLSTELVVSVSLGTVLFFVNWQMTILMIAVLLVMTLISIKGLKPRLNDIGRQNQETQSRIAKWRLQAIYGLKDVKVLNRQDFFIRNYYEQGRIGADIDTAGNKHKAFVWNYDSHELVTEW